MDKNTCHIVAASDIYNERPNLEKGDLLIAADGGLSHLEKLKMAPDIVVGDFDSYHETPHAKDVRRLDPIKDDTDTLKCVKIGLEKGFRRIYHIRRNGRQLSAYAGEFTDAVLSLRARRSRLSFRRKRDYNGNKR